MSLREEILELMFKKIAFLTGKDVSTLSEDNKFVEDLGLKSANIVQVIAALEDEYDVEIPYMSFRRTESLGAAADFVVGLLEG